MNPDSDAREEFQKLQKAYQAIRHGSKVSSSSSTGSQAAESGAAAPSQSWSHHPYARQGHPEYTKAYYEDLASKPTRPSPSFWQLLNQPRAWVRGGAVHRMAHTVSQRFLDIWPVYLLMAVLSTTHYLRKQQHKSKLEKQIYHDPSGLAWVRDGFGTDR